MNILKQIKENEFFCTVKGHNRPSVLWRLRGALKWWLLLSWQMARGSKWTKKRENQISNNEIEVELVQLSAAIISPFCSSWSAINSEVNFRFYFILFFFYKRLAHPKYSDLIAIVVSTKYYRWCTRLILSLDKDGGSSQGNWRLTNYFEIGTKIEHGFMAGLNRSQRV